MPDRPTHATVAVPSGVREPRFRPPATAAGTLDLAGEWRFRLFDRAETGVDPGDDGAGWDTISVPGHWQLAGAPDAWPYGRPAYTNVLFPIPVDPPRVPDRNPTGEYRRYIEVPAQWLGAGRVVLRFEGVDSWFDVSIDGSPIATSHGSRLPTEIDLTEHVHAGQMLLGVRVTQWSAFTYVEDQDQWWLSGIFRDVALLHRPEGGVEHVAVTAGYDHETGRGSLRVDVETAATATVRLPELGIEVGAGEEVSVAVEPWSAEVPRLYEATVSTEAETVTLHVGFRTIAIVDGVFTINGAPVKLYGVNRHEFEPTRGRAVTRETMLADVLLAKAHHVNAVRTSHYPPHPHFLDLCDRHGLYVIHENDFETHGFEPNGWRGNPTDSPQWRDVLVDRVRRVVRRDAHHPSIVMWSLGNEAGTGRNLASMASAIRDLDDSRPLHYEGDRSCEHVDVYSRMYAPTEEVALIGRREEPPLPDGVLDARRRAMPFVLCECAHAMGNGPGGLTEYDDLIDAHPRLMGAFVWEWIDHGIATRTDESSGGVRFHGYGGDFGEELHDGTFIADGLLLPDRTPSPGMAELAAVYAPVRIRSVPGAEALEIRNRYAFRSTEHVTLTWTLTADGELLAEGDLGEVVGVLGPGESALVTLETADIAMPEAPAGAAVWWTVRARHRSEGEPLEYGAGQLLVRERAPLPGLSGPVIRTADGGFAVGPSRFDGAGRLVALGGTAVRLSRADAWRAPTDNDRSGTGDASGWERDGLARLHERLDEVEVLPEDGDALVVSGRLAGAGTGCGIAVRYRWRANGDDPAVVDLTLDLAPEGRWSGPLARLGWLLALEQPDAGAVMVDWVGLGPGESYADSARAALAGRYRHSVAELQTHYTHPQENGARRGVTNAVLRLAAGPLELRAGEVRVGDRDIDGVELTARPWSDHSLAGAAHPHELEPDGALWLHVDAAQHGLGSAACGPGVLPDATLHPASARIQVRLRVGHAGPGCATRREQLVRRTEDDHRREQPEEREGLLLGLVRDSGTRVGRHHDRAPRVDRAEHRGEHAAVGRDTAHHDGRVDARQARELGAPLRERRQRDDGVAGGGLESEVPGGVLLADAEGRPAVVVVRPGPYLVGIPHEPGPYDPAREGVGEGGDPRCDLVVPRHRPLAGGIPERCLHVDDDQRRARHVPSRECLRHRALPPPAGTSEVSASASVSGEVIDMLRLPPRARWIATYVIVVASAPM